MIFQVFFSDNTLYSKSAEFALQGWGWGLFCCLEVILRQLCDPNRHHIALFFAKITKKCHFGKTFVTIEIQPIITQFRQDFSTKTSVTIANTCSKTFFQFGKKRLFGKNRGVHRIKLGCGMPWGQKKYPASSNFCCLRGYTLLPP